MLDNSHPIPHQINLIASSDPLLYRAHATNFGPPLKAHSGIVDAEVKERKREKERERENERKKEKDCSINLNVFKFSFSEFLFEKKGKGRSVLFNLSGADVIAKCNNGSQIKLLVKEKKYLYVVFFMFPFNKSILFRSKTLELCLSQYFLRRLELREERVAKQEDSK